MNRSGLTLLSFTTLLSSLAGGLISVLPAQANEFPTEETYAEAYETTDLPVFDIPVEPYIADNTGTLSRADETALQMHRRRAQPVLEPAFDREDAPEEGTVVPNLDLPESISPEAATEAEYSPMEMTAIEHYNSGIREYNKGNNAAAVASFNAAINADSEYAEAYLFRAAAKLNLEDPTAAMADYSTAIFVQPEYALAYFSRGALFYEMGELGSAMEDFESAIALNPTYVEAYDYLGLAKAAIGAHEEALVDFESAISIDPEYALAHMHRGTSLIQLDEYDSAIIPLSTAIDLRYDYVEAFLNLGVAYYHLGDFDAALDYFNEALDFDSENSEAYYNRSYVYAALRRPNDALADTLRHNALRQFN